MIKLNNPTWFVAFTLYTIIQFIGWPFVFLYVILHWITQELQSALSYLEEKHLTTE